MDEFEQMNSTDSRSDVVDNNDWFDAKGRLEEVYDAYLVIAQRISHVEASMSQMQEDITVLDDRQSRQLAMIDSERTDVSDNRHVAQLDIARQYVSFVEQDLFSLAREEIVVSFRSRSPRHEWIARLIASVCAGLFRVGSDPVLLVKSTQHDRVLARARDIRSQADRLNLGYHWDFYFKPGRQLDEAWQQPWGRCDPAHATKFLVAPAYVVDGTLYQRQWVYTVPKNRPL